MKNKISHLTLVFLLCLPLAGYAQPIPPIDVPVRHSTTTPQTMDLPYKPPPPEILESEDATLDDFLSNDPVQNRAEFQETAKKFDWTTLPYIPFKRPDLKPARDPEY